MGIVGTLILGGYSDMDKKLIELIIEYFECRQDAIYLRLSNNPEVTKQLPIFKQLLPNELLPLFLSLANANHEESLERNEMFYYEGFKDALKMTICLLAYFIQMPHK